MVKYAPVPKERQKEALKWLDENLFHEPTWLVKVPYIWELTDRPDTYVSRLVNNVISSSSLLSVSKIARLGQFAQYDASNYKPEEYLADLEGLVFSELYKVGKVDGYRRFLQRRYVTVALEVAATAPARNTDVRALLVAQLDDIRKRALRAKSADALTQAHWKTLASQIETGLKELK
jgi:hypothetical protein